MQYQDFQKALSDDLEALFAHYAQEMEKIAVKWADGEEQEPIDDADALRRAQVRRKEQGAQVEAPPVAQAVPSQPQSSNPPRDPGLGRRGLTDYGNYIKALLGRTFKRESTENRKLTIAEYLRARIVLEHVVDQSLLETRNSFPVRRLAGEFLSHMKLDILKLVMRHVKKGMEAGVMSVTSSEKEAPAKTSKVSDPDERLQTSDDWNKPPEPDDSMYVRHLAQQHPNVPSEDLEVVSQNFKRKDGKYHIQNRDPSTIASIFLWLTRQGVEMVDENEKFNYRTVWARLNQAMGDEWGGGGLYFNDLVKKNGARAIKILQSKIKKSASVFARMPTDEAVRWVQALGEDAGKEGGAANRAVRKAAKEEEEKKETQRLKRNKQARVRRAQKGQSLSDVEVPLGGKRKKR